MTNIVVYLDENSSPNCFSPIIHGCTFIRYNSSNRLMNSSFQEIGAYITSLVNNIPICVSHVLIAS